MVRNTKSKQTDMRALEKLAKEFMEHAQTKKEASDEMTVIKTKIVELIDKNQDAYFDGKRSFKVGGIEIKLSAEHTYKAGDEFELSTFMDRYPNSVEWKFKHSKMENISLDKWDIEHTEQDKIEVAAVKTKD